MWLPAQQGVIVIATASTKHIDRPHELGAALVIDTTTGMVAAPGIAHYPYGVDALVNLAG